MLKTCVGHNFPTYQVTFHPPTEGLCISRIFCIICRYFSLYVNISAVTWTVCLVCFSLLSPDFYVVLSWHLHVLYETSDQDDFFFFFFFLDKWRIVFDARRACSRKSPAVVVLMRTDLYLSSTPVNVNTRGHFIVQPLPTDSLSLNYVTLHRLPMKPPRCVCSFVINVQLLYSKSLPL